MLSNGEYYEGEFRNDRPHGKGVFKGNKRVVKGVWRDGKLVREE